MNMSIPLSYMPLNPHIREIRVLTILPGCFDEPLQASLRIICLDAGPIYKALSYVWGDPSNAGDSGNTLEIGNSKVPITTNLQMALRQLRSLAGDTIITLWVDAVCINQADLDERTHQVSMMRDIYASAERVIIWLGEADNESDEAFDALHLLSTHDPRRGDVTVEAELQSTMSLYSGFFSGLASHRPWFSRVWIIQELAMAKQDPLVVCGKKSTSWSMFMKAWKFIAKVQLSELGTVRRKGQDGDGRTSGPKMTEGKHLAEEDNIEVVTKLKIDVLDDLYEGIKSQGGESLRKLLMISRTSEATDPRDRIYALLGLLKPNTIESGSESDIIVDYRKPTSAVYADAVAHIFAQGEGPYFLSTVFLPGISSAPPTIPSFPPMIDQPNLPSWVPDFSRQIVGKATQPSCISFQPPAGAGASGAGADCINGKRLDDNRTLQVEGLLVDTIVKVVFLGSSLESCISQLPDIESLAAMSKQQLCGLGSDLSHHIERLRNKEPLWRVLVSNKRFMSGYDPAPSTYEAMHLGLLNRADKGAQLGSKAHYNQGSEYEQSLRSRLGQKSFFTTKNGFFGTCVPASQEGDIIAILFGSPVPFVLRPGPLSVEVDGIERSVHWLIGASYVGGIMNGEMVDELYCEDLMDSITLFIQ